MCLTLLALLFCSDAIGQNRQPIRVVVRGVELHYIEQGAGEPLILLHGGQGDYRSWDSQIEALAPHYRVISYSRRYHFPNNNPLTSHYHSAFTEADDLVAFIRQLKLKRVHLVGTSIGAFTALVMAVKHPEMVWSMVLAEPPVHDWVEGTPVGDRLYHEFMTMVQEPATKAFRRGDDKEAMRIFVDAFGGSGRFDKLPTDGRGAVMENARFFKASLSLDPFPNLSKKKVSRLSMPVLIVTGENTISIHKLVNEELSRLLPKAEQAVIPNAGHGSPRENPRAFNEVALRFLQLHKHAQLLGLRKF